MTFAHTGASYTRGFSRTYHNQVSSSDFSDSAALLKQERAITRSQEMKKKKKLLQKGICTQFSVWLDFSGPAMTPCLAGELVSSAPTAWRRACRPTWTPRASRGWASLCRRRTRASSLAAPFKGTRLSPSLLVSTQSAIAPSTHRDSGPTRR